MEGLISLRMTWFDLARVFIVPERIGVVELEARLVRLVDVV